MPELNEDELRSEAGDTGEQLADEIARKVMASAAAFVGPDTNKGIALARLIAVLILNYADKEVDDA